MTRPRQPRRCARPLRLVVLLLALAAVMAVPAIAATRRPNAAAAASACSQGRSIHARLGAGDLSYVSHFMPCVLRSERAQIGRGFHTSGSLSRAVARALARMSASTALNHGAVKAALAMNSRLMRAIAARACPASARYQYVFDTYDSHPPPVMTSLALAKSTAPGFRGTLQRAQISFGVAARRGLLFRGNDPHGIATGWIAVWCS